MSVFRKKDFKILGGGFVILVVLAAVVGGDYWLGQVFSQSLLLLAVFGVIWIGRFFRAQSMGPFLTPLGWISLGFFSLQAVVVSMILASAMQQAARNVEYEKARCAREGNPSCYVSSYSSDVEGLKVVLAGGSLLCLAGIAWSRRRAVRAMPKNS